jgi:hypothetical protein
MTSECVHRFATWESLERVRPWLGVLSCNAPEWYDRLSYRILKYLALLMEQINLAVDDVMLYIVEALRTVSSLDDETTTQSNMVEANPGLLYLQATDERGQLF